MKKSSILIIPLLMLLCSCNNTPKKESVISESESSQSEESSEILSEESQESQVYESSEEESESLSESEEESLSELVEESESLIESESIKESDSLIESESEEESIIESESEEESESVDPYAEYYKDVITLNKDTLLSTLQDLMFDTQRSYPSYGEIRSLFKYSDADPNKNGNILCFYSRDSISATWDNGVTYNREHVWPKASSGGLYSSVNNDYRGPGSDLHHIRPVITSVNEARGSTKFGTYVPKDEVKGDCARIIMYMYAHYSSAAYGTSSNINRNYVGALTLTNVFTSINLIAEWNALDPVDDLERARNNYLYTRQGNRNPFIDHPEWVNVCLGK